EIPALFAEIQNTVAAGQFAAGFFSYECGSCFEPKAGAPNDRSSSLGWEARSHATRVGEPLAWFGIYARSYAFDHESGSFVDCERPELAQFRETQPPAEPGNLAPDPDLAAEFSLSEAEYTRRIT